MKHRAFHIGSIFAALLLACPAFAQSSSSDASSKPETPLSRERHGFFASIGVGYGSAGINCNECTTDRESSVIGLLRIGGTVSPRVRLGVESTGWFRTDFGTDVSIQLISGVVYYYPSLSNNLWFKGGAGYAHASASSNVDDLSQDGAGITVGVGYDLPFGHSNFVLVPFAAYVRQVSGTVKLNGVDEHSSSNADILQLGVSFGFRH